MATSGDPRAAPTRDIEADVVLLLQACSAALGERVLEDVRAACGTEVRYGDGYVFQHLQAGACSITELARRLGVTQQAASKQVDDLERRGLARRAPHPSDRRTRLVELTPLGRRAIEAGRESRRAIAAEVESLLGARRAGTLRRALLEVSDRFDAVDRMARRELRPESAR